MTDKRRATAFICVLGLLLGSNVALYRWAESETPPEWRSIQTGMTPRLLPTNSLRVRHLMYFDLRSMTRGGFDLRVPTAWDGSVASQNFDVALRGPLLSIGRARSIMPSANVPWELQLEFDELREVAENLGAHVRSGSSRFNNRSPRYQWMIVVQDLAPVAVEVLADDDLNYLFIDSRLTTVVHP